MACPCRWTRFRPLRWTPALLLVLLASLVPSPALPAGDALAQESLREPAPGVFLDVVEVDVVNLEVQVTDRDGNPIRGLTREDFVVLEDGDPVELTNFYEVQSARKVLEPGEAPAPTDREMLVELPQDQVLNLAVVIDNVNISPPNRKRALDQIRDELVRVVRPGDRVMVATLDNVPRVVQSFTDDMAAVRGALDRIGDSTAGNVALQAQKRNIYNLLSQGQGDLGEAALGALGSGAEQLAQPEDHASSALQLIESYSGQADFQMRRSFAAIDALVDSLSGLPSRKAVLLVTEGLSTNPALELYEAFVDSFGPAAQAVGVSSPSFEARRYDLSDLLQDLTRDAAASRVTFYTLDAFGGRGLISAEAGNLRPLAVAVDLQQQDTLVQLAAATGGSAMLNASNVDELVARMAADYSDYYSLGYTSPDSRDGDFHRIQVRVPAVDGARVRHTEGYRAKPLEEEMADRALSALILNVAQNPLEVRIEIGREEQEKGSRYVVPVLVKVPMANLALLPTESSHQGKISISIAVQDADGRLSEPQRVEVPVDIPNDQLLNAMSREVGYGMNVLVRGGKAKLAVAVRDEVSATQSTVNLNIEIGDG